MSDRNPLDQPIHMPDQLWATLQALWAEGRLTLEVMRTAYVRHSYYMWLYQQGSELTRMRATHGNAFMDAIAVLNADLLTFCSNTLDSENSRRLILIVGAQSTMHGSKYILSALKAYLASAGAKLKPRINHFFIYQPKPVVLEDVLPTLLAADTPDLDSDQARAKFAEAIRALIRQPGDADRVLRAAPHSPHARDLLFEAIGFPTFSGLLSLLESYAGASDIPNDTDERNGVIDIARVRALAAPEPDAAARLLRLYAESGVHGSRASQIMLAALGAGRDEIEKDAKDLHQVPIKAFGALPLADGETVHMRYAVLQSLHNAARKFANQRRQNTRAAVRVALHNLAQHTGFTGADALEADMRDETANFSQTEWTSGEYILTLDPLTAALSAAKSGKALKSIPTVLRQTPEYDQAKALSLSLRREISRVRREELEDRLASGAEFSAKDLARLWNFPAAVPMMTALVWINADGATGLLNADGKTLRGLDQRDYPADAPMRLAHPYDLYQQGTLAAWQRAVVHARLVQPVKQVFRELYILTPAEVVTATYSNRFANHHVVGATAARLFDARGWVIQKRGGISVPVKTTGDLRAISSFGENEGAYYFGGAWPFASGRISFSRASDPLTWDWRTQGLSIQPIPLTDVPPLFFSEVMRDADLVTAVAQSDTDGQQISAESFAARGAVVTALIDELELPGVRVEGHFAHVTGRRAKYRVHLGNAAIHIDPGNYLCIVPDRALKPAETLYLPFAEEGDRKVSEVISKIMLLLNDDKITDPSILRQLPRT